MENEEEIAKFGRIFQGLISFSRNFLFKVLSVGPIPKHIAFILDGNRRFAKKHNLKGQVAGHRFGFVALLSILMYCRELGIKYVSVFAFGVDNFARNPELIDCLMDLMLEKIEFMLNYPNITSEYGAKVIFVGDLGLVNERLRNAAERAMEATAKNTEMVILLCLAYSTRYEMVKAVSESCARKARDLGRGGSRGDGDGVELRDIESCMYMAVAPDPDILVRTSGETRLSNFAIWQANRCLLYFPAALWPEIGLRHLVWAILTFQRVYPHLQKETEKEKEKLE